MDIQNKRPKILKKTLDPEWNQEFRYSTWATSQKLLIQVWDYTGRITKKVFIGQVVFSHPDQGKVNGSFPLVDQKGEPVGGTIEVIITCEYLVALERRASQSTMENKKADDPIPDTDFTPADVQPQVLQEIQDNEEKFKEKDKELEKMQKELDEEKEKEKLREKERDEDRKQLEEALRRVAELEEDKKKNSAAIELLEKELAEVRQTVTEIELQENAQPITCCSFFALLLPCCFTSKKDQKTTETTKPQKHTELIEMNEIEQPTQPSLDDTANRSLTPDDSATTGSIPGTPEQSHRYLSDQITSHEDTLPQLEEIPITPRDPVEITTA